VDWFPTCQDTRAIIDAIHSGDLAKAEHLGTPFPRGETDFEGSGCGVMDFFSLRGVIERCFFLVVVEL